MPSEEQLKEMGLNIRQMKQITGCWHEEIPEFIRDRYEKKPKVKKIWIK
jgi:metal-dependent hydrolase (beta-lactamase superfamily II)